MNTVFTASRLLQNFFLRVETVATSQASLDNKESDRAGYPVPYSNAARCSVSLLTHSSRVTMLFPR